MGIEWAQRFDSADRVLRALLISLITAANALRIDSADCGLDDGDDEDIAHAFFLPSQKRCQSAISLCRFSNIEPRLYAASTLSPTLWAIASSSSSFG